MYVESLLITAKLRNFRYNSKDITIFAQTNTDLVKLYATPEGTTME